MWMDASVGAGKRRVGAGLIIAVLAPTASKLEAQLRPPLPGAEAIMGRWNLRLLNPREVHSSWLEVDRSGPRTLAGRFVGLIGGARPIGNVEWSGGVARFTIPAEFEAASGDLRFEARPAGDSVVVSMTTADGATSTYVGRRAPIMRRAAPKAWKPPVSLFNGKDLSGWLPAPTRGAQTSNWIVRDGALVNSAGEGKHLMTVQRFQDVKLHDELGS